MAIRAKQSLGQNWLKNDRVAAEMAAAAGIQKNDRVLEVGPGQGILTAALLERGARVIAVEKDHRLIEGLKQRFSLEIMNDRLEIVHHDILDFDPILINEPYRVVANLPYYLTGEFLKKFLTTPNQPQLMILMLQREVAARIVAKNRKESILSLSVKVYGQPRILRLVSRGNFEPAPKVDSAILLIDRITKNLLVKNKINEKKFFTLLKRGFSGKRKKLKNNLELSGKSLTKLGGCRAEDLSLIDWIKLCATT